jgi:outer membrane lipoprotein-sorting protein
MKFVRTASTRRLLAVIGGLIAAIAAGTAIAVAAAGPGPIPKPKPLATAVHDALAAPKVTGISARITFTNHLIDTSAFQGTDPIITGATGRLWISNDHRIRLELQSDNGDTQVVVNQHSWWISDPAQNTVYEGTLPADHSKASQTKAGEKPDHGIPTIAQIQTDLTKLMKHVNISGAIPSDVAGQAAYTVSVSPKHDGGLLGSAQVAWDAIRGVPLRLAIYARGSSSPVLELKATNISYGAVPASDFNVTPPAGSKVVKISTMGHANAAQKRLYTFGKQARHAARHEQASGVSAVAARLPFKLQAPSTLVGLPRHATELLDWGGKRAALVTYGQNLGGIAVIERTQSAKSDQQSSSQNQDGKTGFSLPTVSINGATAQELDTALGTVVQFSRGGVSYIVLGSVPSAAADAAARAL